MTKILIDRAVVQQALEALKCVDLQSLVPDYGSGHYSVARSDGPQVKSAITAMEAALAEPVQEPVAWTLTKTLTKRETTTNGYLWFSDPVNSSWTPLYAHPPQRPAEPVAYSEGRTLHWHEGKGVNDAQLYLAPPQRKPLTEEDVRDVIALAMQNITKGGSTFNLTSDGVWREIIRAVEAKLKEKNA